MTQGRKKSTFITQDSVPDDHFIDTFGAGVNRKIPKTKFFEQIRKNQQTFIYNDIANLQAANLEADPDDPVFVRVAETGFWLYQITSLAATALDISLDNGTTATRVYEETAVIPLPDITSLSSLNTAALMDGQQFDRREWWPGTGVGGSKEIWDPNMPVSMHNGGTIKDPAKISELDSVNKTFGAYFTPDTVSGNTGCFVVEATVIDPWMFGFYDGLAEAKPLIDAMLSSGVLAMHLPQVEILTSGAHIIPDNLVISSDKCTLKRSTSGYAGTDPILTVGSDVSFVGEITVDGNNPDESGVFEDTFSSVLVTGDSVQFDKITCVNTPMYTEQAKQLGGCLVEGDNFYCREFVGDLCGYHSLRLNAAKNINRFVVDSLISTNHHYKGFAVGNDGTFTIGCISVGRLEASTPDNLAHDASEGIIIDLMNDNTFMGVDSVDITEAIISGGKSNCLKIENTKLFRAGTLNLDFTSTFSGANAATISCEDFSVDYIYFNDDRIRLRSLRSNIGDLVCDHPATPNRPAPLFVEGLTGDVVNVQLRGDRYHHIGNIKILGNPSFTSVVGLNVEVEDYHSVSIGTVFNNNCPIFSEFDLGDAGSRAYREDGRLSVARVIDGLQQMQVASAVESWVQIGARRFQTRTGLPTDGFYQQGDYIVNLDATIVSGTPDTITKGWICTTGGDENAWSFTADVLEL